MPKKRFRPEEILRKLREEDIRISQEESVAEAIRALGVSNEAYNQWS